jgi:hypothetical protein
MSQEELVRENGSDQVFGLLDRASSTSTSGEINGTVIMVNWFDGSDSEIRKLRRARDGILAQPREAFVREVRELFRQDIESSNQRVDVVLPTLSKVYAQVIADEADTMANGEPYPPIDPFTPSTTARYLVRLDRVDGTLDGLPPGRTQVIEVNPKKFIYNVLVRQPDGALVRGIFGIRESERVLPVNRENQTAFSFMMAKTDSHFRSSQGATDAAICETIDFKITCNKLPGKELIIRRSHKGSEFQVINPDASLFSRPDAMFASNLFQNLLTTENSNGMIDLLVERADQEPRWNMTVNAIILAIVAALAGIFFFFDKRTINKIIAATKDNRVEQCKQRWGQLRNMKLFFLLLLVVALFFLTLLPSLSTVIITHGIAWCLLAMLVVTYYRRDRSEQVPIFSHSSWLLIPFVLLTFHAVDMFLSKCNDISAFDHTPLVFAVAAIALITMYDFPNSKRHDDFLNQDAPFGNVTEWARSDPTIPNILRKVAEKQTRLKSQQLRQVQPTQPGEVDEGEGEGEGEFKDDVQQTTEMDQTA